MEQYAILILQGLGGAACVSVIVAGARRLTDKIPRASIPFLVVLLGAGAEALLTAASGTDVSPIRATVFGLGSVWLREIVTTVQEHGING